MLLEEELEKVKAKIKKAKQDKEFNRSYSKNRSLLKFHKLNDKRVKILKEP